MKIVIDTNVVISGTFFGGYPRRIIEAVAESEITAYASPDIVDEYTDTTDEMLKRGQGLTREFSICSSQHLRWSNLNRT